MGHHGKAAVNFSVLFYLPTKTFVIAPRGFRLLQRCHLQQQFQIPNCAFSGCLTWGFYECLERQILQHKADRCYDYQRQNSHCDEQPRTAQKEQFNRCVRHVDLKRRTW